MGGYGDYGFKGYSSKKGKNWKINRNKNIYNCDNHYYNFVTERALYLEELEKSGAINNTSGLIPYAHIPINMRTPNAYTRVYFAIEDCDILKQSLNCMLNTPTVPRFDTVATNRVKLHPDENGIIDYAKDYYNTVLERDNLSSRFLNNNIIALCFNCILPMYMFNLQIYNDIIGAIFTAKTFKSRSTIVKTDVINHRILFIISNIIEDEASLERYQYYYDMDEAKRYAGEDIVFTKHGNVAFDDLSNKIQIIVNHYMYDLIMIKKVKQ